MVPVAIALGSNLGDRHEHLRWALDALRRRFANLRQSTFIETAPVGVPDEQPDYLNAAAVGETQETPAAVLAILLDLERQRGRTRPSPGSARTLDLDLILYGSEVIELPGLLVPHPRFRARRFVLEPLAELVPDWRDPVTGKSVRDLREALEPAAGL